MNPMSIIQELARNREVFKHLLTNLPEAIHIWKPAPDKWCLLEVVCHLYDEEREDFRARVQLVLETPEAPFIPIEPTSWVASRAYMQEDFTERLEAFLKERNQSISWLQSLDAPAWHNTKQHPEFGPMSAYKFLANWLAHDYIHIRQVLKVKFAYLEQKAGEDLSYAGNW